MINSDDDDDEERRRRRRRRRRRSHRLFPRHSRMPSTRPPGQSLTTHFWKSASETRPAKI